MDRVIVVGGGLGGLAAARTDADIAVALRRMLHLVARPDEILGNPALASQLRALLGARPELTAVAAGPTREELAA